MINTILKHNLHVLSDKPFLGALNKFLKNAFHSLSELFYDIVILLTSVLIKIQSLADGNDNYY